jgi:hypothetical protein
VKQVCQLVLCIAVLGLPQVSGAHEAPARRAVVIQAEEAGATILVLWQPSNHLAAALPALQAQWGRDREASRDALRLQWTARALAPLHLRLDGEPVKPVDVESKLVPVGDGEHAGLAVLISLQWEAEGPHRLSVEADSRTRLQWRDRSEGRAASSHRPREWGNRTLALDWAGPQP